MQSERRCISALNFAVCIHWDYSQWIKFPAFNVSHSGSSTPFLGFIWALLWNKIWNLLSPPSPKQWGNPPSVVSKLSVDTCTSLYKLDLRIFATPLKDKDPDVCSAGFTRRNQEPRGLSVLLPQGLWLWGEVGGLGFRHLLGALRWHFYGGGS